MSLQLVNIIATCFNRHKREVWEQNVFKTDDIFKHTYHSVKSLVLDYEIG